ncbi:MAG TPA: hypothetical protein VHT25_07545, partial [Solirubrobacteraceae bacterium]|nr:hypothetical protein [Solirubrobacteraceae bacterium]
MSERAPAPPQRLALVRGGRPLKRWRYVGIFNEQLMACAALVQLGPAWQSFWALYRREHDELRERTRLLPRARALRLDTATLDPAGPAQEPGRLRIDDGGVALELTL